MIAESSLLGHPYEPMMAVSGIDSTIKIFSADSHAQENAELGIDIDSSGNKGQIGYPSLTPRRRRHNDEENPTRNSHEGLTSRKRMHQSYQIMSQNDAQRQGGIRDAFLTVGPFPRMRTVQIGFAEWIAWMQG